MCETDRPVTGRAENTGNRLIPVPGRSIGASLLKIRAVTKMADENNKQGKTSSE